MKVVDLFTDDLSLTSLKASLVSAATVAAAAAFDSVTDQLFFFTMIH